MKKRIIFACLIVITAFACKKDVSQPGNTAGVQIIAQADVPANVLSAFNAGFSTSTEREWRREDDYFICQFNMDDQRQEVSFDDNGHGDDHAVICLDAAVPQVVLNAFRSNFTTDIVYEWKLTSDDAWKAHFLRNGVKYETTMSATGQVLKTEHD